MDGLSFTTFLKLTLMPTTQGKLGTLHRMMASSDGYDFYKRMKLAAREVALDPSRAEEIFQQLGTIKRTSEREHNILMAKRFLGWWELQVGAIPYQDRPIGKYKTPEMAFGVRLTPELMHHDGSGRTVTYLWATKLPKLTRQAAGAGLLMLRKALAVNEYADVGFQILDLREDRIFDENVITNLSDDHLAADIALVNAIWLSAKPLAA